MDVEPHTSDSAVGGDEALLAAQVAQMDLDDVDGLASNGGGSLAQFVGGMLMPHDQMHDAPAAAGSQAGLREYQIDQLPGRSAKANESGTCTECQKRFEADEELIFLPGCWHIFHETCIRRREGQQQPSSVGHALLCS
eukprot:239705-Prymnesium_polylepis.1